jgi:hypothetical protein
MERARAIIERKKAGDLSAFIQLVDSDTRNDNQ